MRRLSRPHRPFSKLTSGSAGDVKDVRVGRANFRFLGFEGRPDDLLLSRFDYVADRLPPLLELRDAVFLPGQRCLYDLDGARIEPSKVTYVEPDAPVFFNDDKVRPIEQATMPEGITLPVGAARVKEPVLFLGEIHDHWGHFITDSLARMWALEQTPPGMKVLFAPDRGERMANPAVGRLLSALGLDDRLLRPEGPTVFETLYCPIAALQLSRIYQEFEGVHRRAAAAISGGGAQAPSGPVYLTRSRLGGNLRRLEGEEELEARLEREGFHIVSPERLGLAEQMAIFNSGRPVVGAFGSAMHTVLFRRAGDGPTLATLFPEKIPPRFMMVDAVKGARATYLRCIRKEGEEESGIWRLDPVAAMRGLDAAGLLGRSG